MSDGNTLGDLRAALFETLRGVRSGDVDLDRARAVNEIAKTLIDSAKVEIDYLKVNGGGESDFIDAVGNDNLPDGITAIRRHRLRG
ncbi:hypothetical protein [Azohydromonas aeria]|uniref:hypothetical protein n=1 Tax=Azohydromonas aeria TaxID=2590212 RepID=UPI0012FBB576|nr:hypothetical protein [Azohydromonas aeria]